MLSVIVYSEENTPIDILLLTESNLISLKNLNLNKTKILNSENDEVLDKINDYEQLLFNENTKKSYSKNIYKNKYCKSEKLFFEEMFYGILIKELINSYVYRNSFMNYYKNFGKLKENNSTTRHEKLIILNLQHNLPHIIDYEWGYICNNLVLEKQHLDTVMSWLSSLGGAFSALGDYDESFAERARAISLKQMKVAWKLKDPNLISRCWLYCAISLIQKYQFKKAAAVIKYEYQWVKSQPEGKVDYRLLNICQGIWAKLKYDRDKWLIMKKIKSC